MADAGRSPLPWLIAAFALATGMAAALWWSAPAPPPDAAVPRIDGEFTLLDEAGARVSWSALNRRRQLVFFGFTHCPEACPTTLLNATRALARRGAAERGTRVLFISVDPERDTPAVVGAYARNFGPAVIGLTGDAAGIDAAAAAFHVFHEKLPPMADGGYMVNHTAALFLLGPADEILEIIPYGATPAEITATLARHPG